jgi:hypothetical protein
VANANVQARDDEHLKNASRLEINGFRAVHKAAAAQKHRAKYGRFFGRVGKHT